MKMIRKHWNLLKGKNNKTAEYYYLIEVLKEKDFKIGWEQERSH